ncbi:Biotin synthesis protein BioC [hydrothermal vent metagenome]|uniref:Biotin synthesis protein BioC n=1 Tax=hydrothermal vent metagenome TaxID=652676 RepID=A0A1W1EBF0_9ZZZZ
MSNVIKEFSRFAHQYNNFNIVQAKVAKKLVSKLPNRDYSSILDIGCGSGAIYENLQSSNVTFDSLTVLDSSENMLAVHPDSSVITKVCENFNSENFLDALPKNSYDLILSSSALQWSEDLSFTLGKIATLSKNVHFAIFTSGTFKTLHKVANITSPIHTAEVIQEEILKHYADANFELHSYTLHFETVLDMFRYIKKSGVSSGEKKLSFKETKLLMKNYPLDYLEFEVLFVEAKM